MSLQATLPLILALRTSLVAAKGSNMKLCASDPFLDPAHDICNPLRYIPSNALTGIAFTLYMICALTTSYFMWRRGARWMASMVIGSYTFSIGLALRFPLHTNPHAKGTYIVEYLLIVLSPCAFIAAVYVLLGRLARYLGMESHLLISPRHITKVFVSSDIATFLVQAVGGSISISGSTSGNIPKKQVGTKIFLVGLALQLASFFFFTAVYLLFLYRVRKHAPDVWNPSPRPKWWKHWRVLALVVVISCIGILIRSFYRTVELSQGFDGRLATSEGFFYGLDSYPLLLAICVYVPFWPGQFIDDKALQIKHQRTEEVNSSDEEKVDA